MIIDGYIAPDTHIALEQGVDFEYPTNVGVVKIRSRSLSMDINKPFEAAYNEHKGFIERRKMLDTTLNPKDLERRYIGLMYDHGVLSWSTTITSGGKTIEPTRENFIALLTSEACKKVLNVYHLDANDELNFRPVTREEDAKNSEALSGGTPTGQSKEKNS